VSPNWYWVARCSGAILGSSVVLVLWALTNADGPLRVTLRRHLDNLGRDLGFLQLRCTARQLALGQVVSLLLAIGCFVFRIWPPFALLLAMAVSPRFVLRAMRDKRVTLIDQQIEAWLVALGNALKASPSLGESLISTLALMRDPIASEIDHIVKEYHLGTPLDQALHNASTRVGSRTFTMALNTLRIARNTGGDLPETLTTSAKSLREMARLDGVVRTKTAEGKAQALVISAIPFPLYFLIEWMQPGFFEPLKHSLTGHVVCGVAALFWVSAAVLAQRILNVDI